MDLGIPSTQTFLCRTPDIESGGTCVNVFGYDEVFGRAYFPDNEQMHYMLIQSRGLQLPWIVSVDLEVVQEDVLSPSEALQSLSLCCP